MKPETIARRAKERMASEQHRKALLLERLSTKAVAAGPDSLWAELYAIEAAR